MKFPPVLFERTGGNSPSAPGTACPLPGSLLLFVSWEWCSSPHSDDELQLSGRTREKPWRLIARHDPHSGPYRHPWWVFWANLI